MIASITSIHRTVQNRSGDRRSCCVSLCQQRPTLIRVSHICTKRDLVTSLCCKIQEAQGSSSTQTTGPPTDTEHDICFSPNHPEKKEPDYQLAGEKN